MDCTTHSSFCHTPAILETSPFAAIKCACKDVCQVIIRAKSDTKSVLLLRLKGGFVLDGGLSSSLSKAEKRKGGGGRNTAGYPVKVGPQNKVTIGSTGAHNTTMGLDGTRAYSSYR